MRFQSIFIGLSKLLIQNFLFFASFCHAFFCSGRLSDQTLRSNPLPGTGRPASWRQNGKQWWPQRSWNHCSHPVAKWHEPSALKKNLIDYILPQEPKKNIFQKCQNKNPTGCLLFLHPFFLGVSRSTSGAATVLWRHWRSMDPARGRLNFWTRASPAPDPGKFVGV